VSLSAAKASSHATALRRVPDTPGKEGSIVHWRASVCLFPT
jgi:hypothetical protein